MERTLFGEMKKGISWFETYLVVAVDTNLEVWETGKSGKRRPKCDLICHRCRRFEMSGILWDMVEQKGITLHLSEQGIKVTKEVELRKMLENCVVMDSGCRDNRWEKDKNTFYVLQVVKSDYKNDDTKLQKV